VHSPDAAFARGLHRKHNELMGCKAISPDQHNRLLQLLPGEFEGSN
jgi:hypothetical protein